MGARVVVSALANGNRFPFRLPLGNSLGGCRKRMKIIDFRKASQKSRCVNLPLRSWNMLKQTTAILLGTTISCFPTMIASVNTLGNREETSHTAYDRYFVPDQVCMVWKRNFISSVMLHMKKAWLSGVPEANKACQGLPRLVPIEVRGNEVIKAITIEVGCLHSLNHDQMIIYFVLSVFHYLVQLDSPVCDV